MSRRESQAAAGVPVTAVRMIFLELAAQVDSITWRSGNDADAAESGRDSQDPRTTGLISNANAETAWFVFWFFAEH